MASDLVADVLRRHAEECAVREHVGCDGREDCRAALDEYTQAVAVDAAAVSFDVGRLIADMGNRWPDERWPTAALLRLVRDQVLEPPYRDPLNRALKITSALARLAERGIPADAVMRTCIGPALLRRIIIQVSAFWTLAREGKADRSRLSAFEAWFVSLDNEPGLASQKLISMPDVVVTALGGQTGEAARRWVAEAAVAHLIGWRLDDYLRVDVSDEDIILVAGSDATQWVFDRFTETYLDEWSRISLEWELVFSAHPAATAVRVGLPLALLQERPVTLGQIVDSMGRRLTGRVGDDPVDGGLRTMEIVETIVSLLRDGDHDEARSLARRAIQGAPENPSLCNALAFCLIPVDPAQAREVLDRLKPTSAEMQIAAEINRVSLHIVDHNREAAQAEFDLVARSDDMGGWFWDPVDLVRAAPHLRYFTFANWRDRAGEAILALNY